MSRKQPIEINVQKRFKVKPEAVFESKVVSSGNGAVIPFYKRFLNKKVLIIIKADKDEFDVLC